MGKMEKNGGGGGGGVKYSTFSLSGQVAVGHVYKRCNIVSEPFVPHQNHLHLSIL